MQLEDIPLPLREHFEQTTNVLGGKLRLRETRISVEQVLELLKAGVTAPEIVESFPSVTPEAVHAVERLAAHCALATLSCWFLLCWFCCCIY